MALNMDDIKEQLGSKGRQLWEQFQESSLYNQGKDHFENLTPVAQKVILIATVCGLCLILLSFPWSYFSQSNENILQFEAKRNVIRDLLKVSREANENPDIPIPPPLESIKAQINNYLNQAQLMPEQIVGVDLFSGKSTLVADHFSQGLLKVSLSKLNLRQIIDLGFQIQSISASLKVLDLNIEANAQNPKYFDANFKLIALNVPQEPIAPPEPPEPPKKKSQTNDEPENR